MDYAAYQVGQLGSLPPSTKLLHGVLQTERISLVTNVGSTVRPDTFYKKL